MFQIIVVKSKYCKLSTESFNNVNLVVKKNVCYLAFKRLSNPIHKFPIIRRKEERRIQVEDIKGDYWRLSGFIIY